MGAPSKGHCENPQVVNVDNRLFSPFYSPWYKTDDVVMCFWTMCDHDSYNAWTRATNDYVEKILKPHYTETVKMAEAHYGGAVMPVDLRDRLKKAREVISGWENAGFKPDKTVADDFLHGFLEWFWIGEIKKIVKHFDQAACQFDELDRIRAVDLERPSAAKGAPVTKLEDIEGGYLGGHGGSPSGGKGVSGIGAAVGLVALGAAGYFGYKVLTE